MGAALKNLTLGLLAVLTSAACAQKTMHSELPALIVAPDTASRSELNQAVSSALGGVDITLADDALTKDSTLLIERRRPRGLFKPDVAGLDQEKPDVFQLLLSASKCVLVHQADGKRQVLQNTRCVPAKGG